MKHLTAKIRSIQAVVVVNPFGLVVAPYKIPNLREERGLFVPVDSQLSNLNVEPA